MAQLSTLKHTTDSLDSIKADAISIGIFKDGSMSSRGKAVDNMLKGQISSAYKRGDVKGKYSETTFFYS